MMSGAMGGMAGDAEGDGFDASALTSAKTDRRANMHSHDRTMIASLGFGDPDKQEPLHDLACRFLAQDDVMRKILGSLLHRWLEPKDSKDGTIQVLCHGCKCEKKETNGHAPIRAKHRASSVMGRVQTSVECPLSKGDGQYRTTVGFIDLNAFFCIEDRVIIEDFPDGKACVCKDCGRPAEACSNAGDLMPTDSRNYRMCLEVKIGKTSINEVIRQIKFYRDYVGIEHGNYVRKLGGRNGETDADSRFGCVAAKDTGWLLATAWAVTQDEMDALKRENINHILLGDGFRSYCDGLKDAAPAKESLVL
jgi:hypothetical protein